MGKFNFETGGRLRSATVTNEKVHAVASAVACATGSLPRWTTTQMIYNVGYKSDFCCVNLAPQAEESQEQNVAFTQHKDPTRIHPFINGFKVCYLNVQFTQPRVRIFVSPSAFRFRPAHFLFLRRSFLSYFLCATKWGLCLSRICPPL